MALSLKSLLFSLVYPALLKTNDNRPICNSTLKQITDGAGNPTALSLSDTAAKVAGSIEGTTTLTVGPAGSAVAPSSINILGSSAADCGPILTLRKGAATVVAWFGAESVILQGGSISDNPMLLVPAGKTYKIYSDGAVVASHSSAGTTVGAAGTTTKRIRHGSVALVGGTATVTDANTTANTRFLLTSNVDGGTPGFLRVSGRTDATDFTITSSSGTDTSTVAWLAMEP